MTLSPTQPNLSNLQGAALVAVRILRANRNPVYIRSLRTATRAVPCSGYLRTDLTYIASPCSGYVRTDQTYIAAPCSEYLRTDSNLTICSTCSDWFYQ